METEVPPSPALTRAGVSIAVALALTWAAFVLARLYPSFLNLPYGTGRYYYDGGWSPLQVSCLVGVEAGLITMLALLLMLLPTMILIWTTALLFDYACNRGLARRELLVRDGSWMARDILITTFKSVVRQGNLVAAIVMLCCLLLLAGVLVVVRVLNPD